MQTRNLSSPIAGRNHASFNQHKSNNDPVPSNATEHPQTVPCVLTILSKSPIPPGSDQTPEVYEEYPTMIPVIYSNGTTIGSLSAFGE